MKGLLASVLFGVLVSTVTPSEPKSTPPDYHKACDSLMVSLDQKLKGRIPDRDLQTLDDLMLNMCYKRAAERSGGL